MANTLHSSSLVHSPLYSPQSTLSVCTPGPEDLRGFYFTPVRNRFIEQHQLSGPRVVGSHLDAGNPPLHRHCPDESEKVQAKPSDKKKGDSFEVIDLTDDTDDEVIDLTND